MQHWHHRLRVDDNFTRKHQQTILLDGEACRIFFAIMFATKKMVFVCFLTEDCGYSPSWITFGWMFAQGTVLLKLVFYRVWISFCHEGDGCRFRAHSRGCLFFMRGGDPDLNYCYDTRHDDRHLSDVNPINVCKANEPSISLCVQHSLMTPSHKSDNLKWKLN